MALITQADVQQWLSDTKTPVPNVAQEPVASMVTSARTKIVSALNLKYDTSAWVDEQTTPKFVRQLISMEVAGRLWLQAFSSRNDGELGYGGWLIKRVDYFLEALCEGTMELEDADTTSPAHKQPEFWPNDRATNLYEDEGDVPGSAPQHFTMGKVF